MAEQWQRLNYSSATAASTTATGLVQPVSRFEGPQVLEGLAEEAQCAILMTL